MLFILALLSIPVIVMTIIQIDYVNSVINNRHIDDDKRKKYSGMVITNLVILSAVLLIMLTATDIKINSIIKIIIILFLCGTIGLNIYNIVVVNRGENISKGAATANLVILYPLIIAAGILFCYQFGPAIVKIVEVFGGGRR